MPFLIHYKKLTSGAEILLNRERTFKITPRIKGQIQYFLMIVKNYYRMDTNGMLRAITERGGGDFLLFHDWGKSLQKVKQSHNRFMWWAKASMQVESSNFQTQHRYEAMWPILHFTTFAFKAYTDTQCSDAEFATNLHGDLNLWLPK